MIHPGKEILGQVFRNTNRLTLQQNATDETPFSEEHVFEVLSNQRRRLTLHYLKQHDEAVATLRNLAEQVAAWEYDKPVWELSANERKSVKNALHQFHLPKMANYGIIDYDPQRGLVTLTDVADQLEVYIEIVPQRDIPWGPYYFLFTLILSPLVVGRWLHLSPLAQLPWVAFTVFFMVAIAVSALVHSYYSYARMRLGASAADTEVTDTRE